MSYDFYMGKILLPVAPSKLQLKIGNANKTVTLINEGEINILKTPGLADIDFEILLPSTEYSFAKYKDGFKPISYYLEQLEGMKANKQPFQFIVVRRLPNGKLLHGINMKVSLEDYDTSESYDQGFDTTVKIRLKQYRDYGTKTCNVKFDGGKPKASINLARGIGSAPSGCNYTVKSGDSLWKIAATQLGNGAKWSAIYEANKSVIGANPNKIYPGQVLTIPDAKTVSSSSNKPKTNYNYGGSKTNPPYTILSSSYGVVRSNITTWNEAYGYYMANGGMSKNWKIVDADKRMITNI